MSKKIVITNEWVQAIAIASRQVLQGLRKEQTSEMQARIAELAQAINREPSVLANVTAPLNQGDVAPLLLLSQIILDSGARTESQAKEVVGTVSDLAMQKIQVPYVFTNRCTCQVKTQQSSFEARYGSVVDMLSRTNTASNRGSNIIAAAPAAPSASAFPLVELAGYQALSSGIFINNTMPDGSTAITTSVSFGIQNTLEGRQGIGTGAPGVTPYDPSGSTYATLVPMNGTAKLAAYALGVDNSGRQRDFFVDYRDTTVGPVMFTYAAGTGAFRVAVENFSFGNAEYSELTDSVFSALSQFALGSKTQWNELLSRCRGSAGTVYVP